MAHKAVTQAPSIPMPRNTGLLRRGARYYLNVRVPTDLREAYGKTEFIRRSLGTNDERKAVSALHFERCKLEAEFDEKRRGLVAKGAVSSLQVIREISDREAHGLVFRWFVELEKNSQGWWDKFGFGLTPQKREEILDDLRIDQTVYSGGNTTILPSDCSDSVEYFMRENGMECPPDSPAFQRLRPLFQRAAIENVRRDQDRVTRNGDIRTHDPLLKEVFAHTELESPEKSITVSDLLERYSKWLHAANRTQGTHRTYELPIRLFREFFGGSKLVATIDKDDVEQLFDLLKRAPVNASKRYRNKTLQDAVKAADDKRDLQRLGGKTLTNYFNNISAIFNFAVEKGALRTNPAKDRYLRALFTTEDSKEKALFSIPELNRIFHAPLYTGCRDDGNGYAKPGVNLPRRGRFWVPLIALFQGLRCSEAVQLYSEDVGEEDEVPFLFIRAERADGAACDKRLKTKQSKRRVPFHPELIRLGFLDFVKERKADGNEPRLFPELPCGKAGYFSDPFSKWFSGFKKATLGGDCSATFHSFRHNFRSALTVAEVPIPDVERLGGWEIMKRSAESQYSRDNLKHLRKQIAKVEFPGLDLSHLIPQASSVVVRRRRRPQVSG